MKINSIATLPIFSMINNDKKMTKEEIVKCLKKENYEDNEGMMGKILMKIMMESNIKLNLKKEESKNLNKKVFLINLKL